MSVVPQGVLGDDFLSVLGKAYPDGQGCENLRLVRREAGDVGIYHVWPKEHKLWFQRHRSVFGLMDPGWFSREFWINVLSEDASNSTPQVLHVTGITPLISVNTRTAWSQALEAAMALKKETSAVGRKLVVTMDLNHRPALGAWGDLWQMAEPHLGTVDVLVFSIGDVIQVGNTFGEHFADDFKVIRDRSPGLAGAKELDQTVCRSIAKLQLLLGSRTNLAVTCKVREVQTPPGQPPSQLRWSVLCTKEGDVLSTFSTAVPQKVVEEIGGGDSWLSGLIDGLVGTPSAGAFAPRWPKEIWLQAMRRGDMLAALKQQVMGDFSNIERAELEAALAAHHKP